MTDRFWEQLTQFLPPERIWRQEPMSKHTTFQIGGPADYFAEPADEKELTALLKLAKEEEMPYFLLGKGSNLLVNDLGFRGLVIHFGSLWEQAEIEGEIVTAGCGMMLARLGQMVLKAELTGFEFAAGIPGTLGGAVYMNAGAYGGEMKDILLDVTVLDEEGRIVTLPVEALELAYRGSIFHRKDWCILKARMRLQKGDADAIRSRMQELAYQRQSKQPLTMPSAGSVFKRPEGYYAGALIQDCQLKGYRIGGAQVSEKHAGFIVNTGGATAEDVVNLVRHIQHQVWETFHVHLEPELRILEQKGFVNL